MKRRLFVGMTVLLLSFCLALVASGATGPRMEQSPQGLEAYYPPKADGPIYLFRMLDLERAFSGIAAELMEDDLDGARKMYGEFAAEYRAAKGMVEEWKDAFPEGEVESMGRTIQGNDRGAMFQALEAVGALCHRCHVATMVSTQQKYRWGDFSTLAVDDTKNGQPKPYGLFKKFIAASMAGIDVDAGQGQWQNARKHFVSLKERVAVLSETCGACHAERPGYLADAKTLGLLEEEIGKDQPDRGKISGLLKGFGGEACGGCHLIHVPAAMRAAVVR